MTLPRFFHPDLRADQPVELSADEAHHLRHVLRLRPGDAVLVFDGSGLQRHATVDAATKAAVTLLPGALAPAAPELPIDVTLGMALLKADAMDQVVRDAVMLGVNAIAPVITGRSVTPGSAAREPGVLARWRRIALAATKQCGRAVTTRIEPVRTLDDLLRLPPRHAIVLVEPGLEAPSAPVRLPREGFVTVLSGPEGGWTAEELSRMQEAGAEPLSLGPMTLRAEVAPVAALGVLSWWATRSQTPEL